MRHVIASAGAFLAVIAGCLGQPDISLIATNYTSFQKITDKAVEVNPELAMLCVGASDYQVKTARIKFGPHANTSILIYMNESAANAFTNKTQVYPEGSVIIKQKHIGPYRDSLTGNWMTPTNKGVGGMLKRPAGFNPSGGDWEFFYFENPARIEHDMTHSCVQCHQSARQSDYVFGTWAHTADK